MLHRALLRFISSSATSQPVIPVQFNPTDYTITRNQKYAPTVVPGLAMPLLQYIGGETQTLALALLLDASDRTAIAGTAPTLQTPGTPIDGSLGPTVETRLAALRQTVQVQSDLHAPPVVQFEWNGGQFVGVVVQYSEQFTLFDEEGRIQRARITLSLNSYQSAESLYRTNDPHSPDRTKTRVVRSGERLDMIAAQEYGDPALWPAIARANRLARPRLLVPGTLLVVPPLD